MGVTENVVCTMAAQQEQTWQHGKCDLCADGFGGCLCAFMCTSCYYAKSRTLFDESNWCFNLLCVNPVAVRNIVREGYGIRGTCLGDIGNVLCCSCCTAIQLRQEVTFRGSVADRADNNEIL